MQQTARNVKHPALRFRNRAKLKRLNPAASRQRRKTSRQARRKTLEHSRHAKPKSRSACISLRTIGFHLPSGSSWHTSRQADMQQTARNVKHPALRFRNRAKLRHHNPAALRFCWQHGISGSITVMTVYHCASGERTVPRMHNPH